MRIVRSETARRDLLQIYAYLAERNPQAADRLVEDIDAKLKMLGYFPFLGRDRSSLGPRLRSLVVSPYLIFYTAEPDQITLVRVLHGRRDIDEEFRR